MASSVFIECCTKSLQRDLASENGNSISATPDSNLVVVYGKGGVNFDHRGIENLIVEKSVSSISVIRLTSPTPSMIGEEEEAEKAEELMRRQANGLSDDDSSSQRNSSSIDEGVERSESEEIHTADDEKSDVGSENSVNNHKSETRRKKKKNRRKLRATSKIKNTHNNKTIKERPDIIGLTVEEFYSPITAKEVVKEALKLAGVSTFKRTADYEFQLLVIRNDHCYTPFTSPAQMKAKMAEKYKVEKQAAIGRRIIPHTAVTMKQLQLKKKILQDSGEITGQTGQIGKEHHVKILNKHPGKLYKQNEKADCIEDDNDVYSSTAESDFDVLSDVSGDTDNDRDSDLDFNVNNRKGRKKKDLVTKAKRLSTGKVCVKRSLVQQEDADDQRNKNVRLITASISNRQIKTGPAAKAGYAPVAVQKLLSDAVAALPPIPKRSAIAQREESSVNSVVRQQIMPSTVRRGPTIEVGIQKAPINRTQLQSSPQSVKEIVINKVMASPKGGFTEIGEFLSQADEKPTKVTPVTSTSSNKAPATKIGNNPTSSKGFMPLGVETASKNKLPVQISIQTHQSSSELAKSKVLVESQQLAQLNSNKPAMQSEQSSAELASEQFDLIVSIVKDEMRKNSLVEVTSKSNENIPKLVKMLENAEHSLESNASNPQVDQNLNNFGSSTEAGVGDIDISNAPLLDTPDGDEIPEDLLQHVVDLIEDDETLQEAVEKQVFGEGQNETITCVSSGDGVNAKVSSIATGIMPTSTVPEPMQQESPQPKSIIEMTISNLPSTSASTNNADNNGPVRVYNLQTPKAPTSALIRKEPIQIVRGNGRVITLPPIEAPTTRAKRRAQNQPVNSANTNAVFNESSMDSSMQSNSSLSIIEHTTPIQIAVEKKNEAANKRRVSKEATSAGTSAGKAKKAVSAKKTNVSKINTSKAVVEEYASGSQEDDDDPNRLWCICRQPHNNRFMICCDVCEDWFHGTCVSITKAMGIEMEQKGIDWTCPKCVKLQEEKKQRKITDMLIPRKVTSDVGTGNTDNLEISSQVDIQSGSNLEAVVHDTAPLIDKSNLLENAQIADTKKLQYDDVTPIKPQLKKASKIATSSAKKKQQTLILKQRGVNPPTSLTKQRQSMYHDRKQQVELNKSTAATQSPNSLQQTFKDVEKPIIPEPISTDPLTFCIVCKRTARQNSIYCSDECIRKHAQNALNMFAAISAAKPPELNLAPIANEEISMKKKKSKGLFEDILSMADRKPKIERIHVIERKSGRVLTGNSAPTTHNLKKWLQDNQTFEVVQPGSIEAQEVERKQRPRNPAALPPILVQNVAKHITSTSIHNMQGNQSPHSAAVINKTAAPQIEQESQMQRPVKQLIEQVVKSTTNSPRPGTPKQLQKYPQQVSIKADKTVRSESKEEPREKKEKSLKQRPMNDAIRKHPETMASVSTNSEPIRINVRRTLKEQLLQRMNEIGTDNESEISGNGNLPKLSIAEIENFVTDTEAEMYDYFSRDTGSRYRAKYRSLMFNIKDRKNHTLFAKICAKKIQPKQLVRMSPEELASQELAQWRENEAKHQLEMIKKSELDMLSCAKNYVLKTHKGEEVIEGKIGDCVNLDTSIPVEHVVSVLNNSVVSSSGPVQEDIKIDSELSSLYFDIQSSSETQSIRSGFRLDDEKSKSHSKEKDRERECDDDKDRQHGREREHSHARARSHDSDHSREKQRKSKDRHRDKSRSRKRSRSQSRSRSHSREKRHKSYHKDEKRERVERDRDKDKYKDKERHSDRAIRQHKDEVESRSLEKPPVKNLAANINSNKNNLMSSSKEKNYLKKPVTPKPLEVYSLIDQILESTKTVEEAANLISEREKEKQRESMKKIGTMPLSTSLTLKFNSEQEHAISSAVTNDDQEPSSTVTIATPPPDPYIRYTDIDSPTLTDSVSTAIIWSGNINMVDVASFHIILQPVVGNSLNMGSLFPDELDVVGRIGPDTVWEYISKIKRSPNKEIVIIRLIPSSETETAAYTVLFQYLENRNRLGVINTVSPQIKDFYIYPLGAGKPMPPVLLPAEKVDFYEDTCRPDILVGVVVRIIGKRLTSVPNNSTSLSVSKSHRRVTDAETFTPPGSPKRKRRMLSSTPKVAEIDVDAIIKAPIATKSHKAASLPSTTLTDDADEPYSPGGSSDDDTAITPKITSRSDEDELKRKMEELNRQIAAQEKEIAGLLNVESSCFTTASSSKTSAVLANISIPSNLSQILASIKSKPDDNQSQLQPQSSRIHAVTKSLGSVLDDEEYNPELASFEISVNPTRKTSSRLAQLSEAELMSMVPDGIMDAPVARNSAPVCTDIKTHFEEPPPPGV